MFFLTFYVSLWGEIYIYVICKLAGHISHNCLRRSCTHRWAGGVCVPPLTPVDTLQGWGHAPRRSSEHAPSGWQQRPERSSPSPRCLAAAGANQPGSWWVAVAAGVKHPGSRIPGSSWTEQPSPGCQKEACVGSQGKGGLFFHESSCTGPLVYIQKQLL